MPATTLELEQPVGPFNTTAAGVAGLVPQAVIETAGTPVDPRSMVVTVTQVQQWLRELSGRLVMAVPRWVELTGGPADEVAADADGVLYMDPLTPEVGVDVDGVLYLNPDPATPVTDRALFVSAARDAVHNGAASYLQAARHPELSRINGDSYSAVLWARFGEALTVLADFTTGRLPEQVPPAAAGVGGVVTGSFPPVLFGDASYRYLL